MSDLTSEKLMKIISEFHEKYPPPPSRFAGLFRPLVGAEFANRTNAWLAARFGFQEDSIYFMSGFGILASKRNIGMIMNVSA